MINVILFSIVVSSINEFIDVKTDIKQIDEKYETNGGGSAVLAKVYVEYPNFVVIDEKDTNMITLIKNAEIPQVYEGTLLKLKSEDLTYTEKVLINLNIEEVIMYKEDVLIAKVLMNSGFTVTLK